MAIVRECFVLSSIEWDAYAIKQPQPTAALFTPMPRKTGLMLTIQ